MPETEIVEIAYGTGAIPLRMDPRAACWEVIRPKPQSALPNAREAFSEICKAPIDCAPLAEIAESTDKVVIVTSDGTRPVPNRLLIPWIVSEMGVPDENVTILLGNGSHRANSPEEIEAMFGAELASRFKILNHNAFDPKSNEILGTSPSGGEISVDRVYLEADKRIVVGFIEPHFFAGFSGGAKGVIPAVAGIDTIRHLHRFELIAHASSSYGVMDGNPIQGEIAEMVSLCPPDFLVNVTLNSRKEIAGIFAGDYRAAHRQGCAEVRETSMAAVSQKFPIVVTSNSGYPLDQNLYQTVKGISAAARIVEDGGAILVASECRDGIPAHGKFGELMAASASPREVLRTLEGGCETVLDQWQAQILAGIQSKAEIEVFSGLSSSDLKRCHLKPGINLQESIERRLESLGPGSGVAVLPDGPVTIPYLNPDLSAG